MFASRNSLAGLAAALAFGALTAGCSGGTDLGLSGAKEALVGKPVPSPDLPDRPGPGYSAEECCAAGTGAARSNSSGLASGDRTAGEAGVTGRLRKADRPGIPASSVRAT